MQSRGWFLALMAMGKYKEWAVYSIGETGRDAAGVYARQRGSGEVKLCRGGKSVLRDV